MALQKRISRKLGDKTQIGRKYLQEIQLTKDCYAKHKEFLKVNDKKTNNSGKKMGQGFQQTPHQRRDTDGK